MKLVIVLLILVSVTALSDEKPFNVHTTGGRFQLIQLSSMRRDQYLIDTQTGQVWSSTCLIPDGPSPACGYTAWMKEDIEGITLSNQQIMKKLKNLEDYKKKRDDQGQQTQTSQ